MGAGERNRDAGRVGAQDFVTRPIAIVCIRGLGPVPTTTLRVQLTGKGYATLRYNNILWWDLISESHYR